MKIGRRGELVALLMIGVAVLASVDALAADRGTPAAGTHGAGERRSPRPDAPACRPDGLRGPAWTGVRARGDAPDAVVVLLANERDTRCTLTGSAGLVATDPAGRRTAVPTSPAPRPADPVGQYPATIDPGEPARLVFTLRGGCGTPVRYTAPAIVVAGREVPVEGTAALTTCGLSAGEWHVVPPVLNR